MKTKIEDKNVQKDTVSLWAAFKLNIENCQTLELCINDVSRSVRAWAWAWQVPVEGFMQQAERTAKGKEKTMAMRRRLLRLTTSQWPVAGGQWAVGSEQWAVGSEQWGLAGIDCLLIFYASAIFMVDMKALCLGLLFLVFCVHFVYFR